MSVSLHRNPAENCGETNINESHWTWVLPPYPLMHLCNLLHNIIITVIGHLLKTTIGCQYKNIYYGSILHFWRYWWEKIHAHRYTYNNGYVESECYSKSFGWAFGFRAVAHKITTATAKCQQYSTTGYFWISMTFFTIITISKPRGIRIKHTYFWDARGHLLQNKVELVRMDAVCFWVNILNNPLHTTCGSAHHTGLWNSLVL